MPGEGTSTATRLILEIDRLFSRYLSFRTRLKFRGPDAIRNGSKLVTAFTAVITSDQSFQCDVVFYRLTPGNRADGSCELIREVSSPEYEF